MQRLYKSGYAPLNAPKTDLTVSSWVIFSACELLRLDWGHQTTLRIHRACHELGDKNQPYRVSDAGVEREGLDRD
jgi:hypothetical protein